MLNKINADEAPIANCKGSQSYNFIEFEDIARCNISALTTKAKDEFYKVGTVVRTTTKELCYKILELKKSTVKMMKKSFSIQKKWHQRGWNILNFSFKYDLKN